MTLQEKFSQLKAQNSAILATNFYNFETLKGVSQAASDLELPIIFQATQKTIDYMGLDVTIALARSAIKQFNIEAWLHLDHADSYELIASCLEAGFDSVMIDASEKPFEENVYITKKIVELARSYGANVEAELGYVAKLGQEQSHNVFTSPEEARLFVNETGVNALAVAIGSAHGFYQKEPKLQLDLLNEINNTTNAALVLHGGSGIPDEQLREGIQRGIRKINLATEIKDTFMSALQKELRGTQEIDLRKVFPTAIDEITALVKQKLIVVNRVTQD